MVTSKQCYTKYGNPSKERNMIVWTIPDELKVDHVPRKIYCNKDLIQPLSQVFKNLKETGYDKELKTWDGCFNIRRKRGSKSTSLHSWGIAIDLNAAWNGFGKTPTLSPEFVKCFTDAGFDWGGYWKKPDGMHFQLSKLP